VEDETALLVLFGIWLLNKLGLPELQEPLQRGGAKLYDLTHLDTDHSRDLPRPERTLQARFDTLRRFASSAGFQGEALDLAVAIGMVESGGNPKSVRIKSAAEQHIPEHSVGLWQVNILAHPEFTHEWLLDPHNNARAAYQLSNGGTDWSAWRHDLSSGKVNEFLPGGKSYVP